MTMGRPARYHPTMPPVRFTASKPLPSRYWVACALRPPLPLACAAIALFGAAHGYAHGLEAPALGGLPYAEVAKVIELLATDVMPVVQRATAAG